MRIAPAPAAVALAVAVFATTVPGAKAQRAPAKMLMDTSVLQQKCKTVPCGNQFKSNTPPRKPPVWQRKF